jgi:hypothetical protein
MHHEFIIPLHNSRVRKKGAGVEHRERERERERDQKMRQKSTTPKIYNVFLILLNQRREETKTRSGRGGLPTCRS